MTCSRLAKAGDASYNYLDEEKETDGSIHDWSGSRGRFWAWPVRGGLQIISSTLRWRVVKLSEACDDALQCRSIFPSYQVCTVGVRVGRVRGT